IKINIFVQGFIGFQPDGELIYVLGAAQLFWDLGKGSLFGLKNKKPIFYILCMGKITFFI
ncbi:MAG: hypothetical protein ACUVWV_12740, partial [Thermodesulfobacteriota bacterium]